ncbi:hypothetical protein JCM33374_g6457 [Metschnikowia sp. JCM 33374]|nr:hypothetical protein JCM33374_g6457 [Metschnikowia sp. JCM 33374]
MAAYLYTHAKDESSSAPTQLLTPENCESSSRIRAFLRLSRIATDDSIIQHLNEIGPSQCEKYFNQTILPQWRARADAIHYCSGYAKSLRNEAQSKETTINQDYDLRIDPYALKNAHDFLDRQYSRCVSVENWVANEANVETILHEQTASVLSDKCYYKDWLQAFKSASGTQRNNSQ